MLSGIKLFERKYLVIVFLVIFIAIAVFVAVANIKEDAPAMPAGAAGGMGMM